MATTIISLSYHLFTCENKTEYNSYWKAVYKQKLERPRWPWTVTSHAATGDSRAHAGRNLPSSQRLLDLDATQSPDLVTFAPFSWLSFNLIVIAVNNYGLSSTKEERKPQWRSRERDPFSQAGRAALSITTTELKGLNYWCTCYSLMRRILGFNRSLMSPYFNTICHGQSSCLHGALSRYFNRITPREKSGDLFRLTRKDTSHSILLWLRTAGSNENEGRR